MKRLKNLSLLDLKKLARSLAADSKNQDIVIGLVGPLGAGKTTFVKEFASQFKIKNIKSPTFIIGGSYPTSGKTFYHFDFYRLEEAKQLTPIGFNEILTSLHRIVLIEWVDKFPEIQKKCDLVLTFSISGPATRNVSIE